MSASEADVSSGLWTPLYQNLACVRGFTASPAGGPDTHHPGDHTLAWRLVAIGWGVAGVRGLGPPPRAWCGHSLVWTCFCQTDQSPLLTRRPLDTGSRSRDLPRIAAVELGATDRPLLPPFPTHSPLHEPGPPQIRVRGSALPLTTGGSWDNHGNPQFPHWGCGRDEIKSDTGRTLHLACGRHPGTVSAWGLLHLTEGGTRPGPSRLLP